MVNAAPTTDQRAKLVESALAVAERIGIESVSDATVAEEAGVSIDEVHLVFESREDLFSAMGDSVVLMLSAALRYALSVSAQTTAPHGVRGLRILLHSGMSAIWPLIEATPKRQMLTYELTMHALRLRGDKPPEEAGLLDAVAREQYRIMDSEAIAFLNECARQSGTTWIEPVNAIACYALAVLQGVMLRWLVVRDPEVMITQLDDLVATVASKAVEA